MGFVGRVAVQWIWFPPTAVSNFPTAGRVIRIVVPERTSGWPSRGDNVWVPLIVTPVLSVDVPNWCIRSRRVTFSTKYFIWWILIFNLLEINDQFLLKSNVHFVLLCGINIPNGNSKYWNQGKWIKSWATGLSRPLSATHTNTLSCCRIRSTFHNMMDQTRANSIVGLRLWRSSTRLFSWNSFCATDAAELRQFSVVHPRS